MNSRNVINFRESNQDNYNWKILSSNTKWSKHSKTNQNKMKKNLHVFFYKNQYFSSQPQTDSYFIMISAS